MLSLIPLPWRIVIAVALFALIAGGSFYEGVKYERNSFAAEQKVSLDAEIKRHNEEQSKQMQDALASLERLSTLDKKLDGLKSAVDRDIAKKPVFQNKDCKLDDESLKLFNGEAQ